MRRRSVIISGLAGVVSVSVRSFAQRPATKIPRVGILTPADSDRTPIFDAFRAGLRDLGYVEGRNIISNSAWLAVIPPCYHGWRQSWSACRLM